MYLVSRGWKNYHCYLLGFLVYIYIYTYKEPQNGSLYIYIYTYKEPQNPILVAKFIKDVACL